MLVLPPVYVALFTYCVPDYTAAGRADEGREQGRVHKMATFTSSPVHRFSGSLTWMYSHERAHLNVNVRGGMEEHFPTSSLCRTEVVRGLSTSRGEKAVFFSGRRVGLGSFQSSDENVHINVRAIKNLRVRPNKLVLDAHFCSSRF